MKTKLSILVAVLVAILNPIALAQQIEMQTFTTEDGAFSFKYPVDWSVETVNADRGSHAHFSVNNLPLDERFEAPTGIQLQISFPRKFYEMGFVGGETPSEMVSQLVQGVPGFSQQTAIDFSTPSIDGTPQPLQMTPTSPNVTEFLVSGRPAAFTYSVLLTGGIDASQLIVVADLGDDYWVSISAFSFAGGLETIQLNEPTILQIVQSMTYTPMPRAYSGNPDLPEVYSGLVGIWQRGNIQFFYPTDWYVANSIMVMFSNKRGNLLNTLPESGQFIAVVQGVSETIASVDQIELFNNCNTQSSNWTAKELVARMLEKITSIQLEQLDSQGITITQPEVITVNNIEIVYLRQYQDDFEVLAMFIELGEGNVASMSVTSKQGEMILFEDRLFAVASTFQYTPKLCDDIDTNQ